jgi:hypothetical protein
MLDDDPEIDKLRFNGWVVLAESINGCRLVSGLSEAEAKDMAERVRLQYGNVIAVMEAVEFVRKMLAGLGKE